MYKSKRINHIWGQTTTTMIHRWCKIKTRWKPKIAILLRQINIAHISTWTQPWMSESSSFTSGMRYTWVQTNGIVITEMLRRFSQTSDGYHHWQVHIHQRIFLRVTLLLLHNQYKFPLTVNLNQLSKTLIQILAWKTWSSTRRMPRSKPSRLNKLNVQGIHASTQSVWFLKQT